MKSHILLRRWTMSTGHVCPLGGVLVVIAPVEIEFNELVIWYDSHLPRFVSITTLVIGAPGVRPYSNLRSYLMPRGAGWMIIKRLAFFTFHHYPYTCQNHSPSNVCEGPAMHFGLVPPQPSGHLLCPLALYPPLPSPHKDWALIWPCALLAI